jgi:hypothetical protein
MTVNDGENYNLNNIRTVNGCNNYKLNSGTIVDVDNYKFLYSVIVD